MFDRTIHVFQWRASVPLKPFIAATNWVQCEKFISCTALLIEHISRQSCLLTTPHLNNYFIWKCLKAFWQYVVFTPPSKAQVDLHNKLFCVFVLFFSQSKGGRYLDSTSSGSSSRSQSPLLLSPAGSQNTYNNSGPMLRSLRYDYFIQDSGVSTLWPANTLYIFCIYLCLTTHGRWAVYIEIYVQESTPGRSI